jgi:hypothetical protein
MRASRRRVVAVFALCVDALRAPGRRHDAGLTPGDPSVPTTSTLHLYSQGLIIKVYIMMRSYFPRLSACGRNRVLQARGLFSTVARLGRGPASPHVWGMFRTAVPPVPHVIYGGAVGTVGTDGRI